MPTDEYDDSPWTRSELEAVASEVAQRTGWEEMDDDKGGAEART